MDEPYRTSIAFFNTAHSYAASAIELRRLDVQATHADSPVQFLFFHSIELYLKAFLIAKGFTEQKLRSKKFGHKICCLANEGEVHGLVLSDSDRLVVLNLSETDNIISSRYIRLGVHFQLPIDVYHETCFRLHEQIGPKVYEGSGVSRIPVLEPAALNKLHALGKLVAEGE